MCGICGIFHLDGAPASPVLIQRMSDAIAHRGPDGEGAFIDGPLGLGHRRLSILDLSTLGRQPMQTPDGRFTIVFNGEVYNFQELRVELESLGHCFRSRTDTEVLLHAYAQWGASCVERFNGMFALVIWDRAKRELFLARDRYGIKPLYYTLHNNTFLFASEQKAILTYPGLQREIDLEALLEYFTFQNLFTDRTLLKDIKLFPPGSHATIPLSHQPPATSHEPRATSSAPSPFTQYWDYDFQEPEHQHSEEEYLEELDRLFRQAVQRQLVSDVEVNAYLSGGMDSGAITAIAAQHIAYIKSFTCGFDLTSASGLELGFDEREKAEFMSYLFKTEHYEIVLKAGDMERCLPRLAWHVEEPRVGQSYPNFYISGLAAKFGKVVLAGTGGDELFGGYPWRYYRAVVNSDFQNYIDKYYLFWQRLISNREIQAVFRPVWDQVKHVWTRDLFEEVFKRRARQLVRPEDYVNHSLYFEARTFLHGLLVVEDKLSMAHGLESRVPFLDNDLVDFAMRLPVKFKLGNLREVVRINENEPDKGKKYFQRTRDGKLLLRKAMSRYVPDSVTQSVKQGFSAPDASWFKGESIAYVSNQLVKRNARIYEYLDGNAVRPLILEHLEGKKNRRLLIWSLLNLEHWLDQYLPN
ncbi:asparagine synthase (glutamine-hydrolyzing) [Desulfonatronum parangueonense]